MKSKRGIVKYAVRKKNKQTRELNGTGGPGFSGEALSNDLKNDPRMKAVTPPTGWTPATEAQIRAGTHGGADMTPEQIKIAQTYQPYRFGEPALPPKMPQPPRVGPGPIEERKIMNPGWQQKPVTPVARPIVPDVMGRAKRNFLRRKGVAPAPVRPVPVTPTVPSPEDMMKKKLEPERIQPFFGKKEKTPHVENYQYDPMKGFKAA